MRGRVQSESVLWPHHLPNLAAWFRFGRGITVTGAGVSQWDDVSGNARHLKQGTDTNRPALQADGSILFDGVDNFLKCDAFTLNQPDTWYVLCNPITWTSGDVIVDGDLATATQIQQVTSSPKIRIRASTGLGDIDFPLGSYGVVAAVFNGASSSLQLNNGAPLTGDAGTVAAAGATLGARGDGAAGWANIRVKELIIFAAAHDAITRKRLIHYLRTFVGTA